MKLTTLKSETGETFFKTSDNKLFDSDNLSQAKKHQFYLCFVEFYTYHELTTGDITSDDLVYSTGKQLPDKIINPKVVFNWILNNKKELLSLLNDHSEDL